MASNIFCVFVFSSLMPALGLSQEDSKQTKDLPSAEKIIDRYIRLIGGYEVIQSASSWHCEMSVVSISEAGLTLEYEAYQKDGSYFEQYIGSDGRTTYRGIKEGVGWDRINGNLRELSQAEVASCIRLFSSRSEAPNWIKTCKEVRCAARQKVRGQDVYRVHFVFESGLTSDRYFDVKSGLLVRSVEETIHKGSPQKVTFEVFQYEQFGEQLMRKKQRVTYGNKTYDFVVDVCEFNVEVPDETFDLPASIQSRVALKKRVLVEHE